MANERKAAALVDGTNPLLRPWNTPYGLPPFDAVRPEHFEPALEVAMAEHLREIDALGRNPHPADFANTVAALDGCGRSLSRIEALLSNLTSSHTTPALQEVEMRVAPRLAAHGSAVSMHRPLFERIAALHGARESMQLSEEQRRLLERVHLDFVRAGALLAPAEQEEHARIVARLAELTTRFGQNVLADESAYRLVLVGPDDAAGLPDFVRATARQAALERGIDDALVITLSRSHIVPFLTFSDRRDLREAAYRAWTTRGEHDGANDNRAIAAEILSLRRAQARLHGDASYADYALADTMARSQTAVSELLMQVWAPAKARLENERQALQTLAGSLGRHASIEAWDWRYYAEKVRSLRFGLDEAEIKPYFALPRMVEALFDCARRLFGICFAWQPDVAAYHPDVQVYEVSDAGGALIGVFLHDNYARVGKRSGAWMSLFRHQSGKRADGDASPGTGGGERVIPLVLNNNNFARGTAGEPALLSFDDAVTLFHEFGHGLHGLLSNVHYERLAGINVLRDFVELPSQLFEHWLAEPEVLKRHARHHRTGEPIPDALVARLQAARLFNQGYETVRYTASALVDMAAHACTGEIADVVAFEADELERLGMPPGVGMNHRLVHFQHLFSGSSYAAGYYVYLWAEVLEADGYEAFVEARSPFDAKVAARLQRYIYATGNSMEPSAAYRAFRGRAPTVAPMLRQRGLVDEADAAVADVAEVVP